MTGNGLIHKKWTTPYSAELCYDGRYVGASARPPIFMCMSSRNIPYNCLTTLFVEVEAGVIPWAISPMVAIEMSTVECTTCIPWLVSAHKANLVR